jgi:hypothetical protein
MYIAQQNWLVCHKVYGNLQLADISAGEMLEALSSHLFGIRKQK